MDMELLKYLKEGDEIEIIPIDKFPNADRKFKINYFSKDGFVYGLSETCDGYEMPFNWIKGIAYETFNIIILRALAERYPQYNIKKTTVYKNNEVLTGLSFIKNGSNTAPQIYTNYLWNRYTMENKSITELVEEVASLLADSFKEFDVSFFTDFSIVKEKIQPRLVSYENNLGLLKNIPHRRWLDLAIYYVVEIDIETWIVIKTAHMDLWNVTEEELYKLAIYNTKYSFLNISYPTIPGIELPVLTNTTRTGGAAAILKALEDNALEGEMLLIPSSINEWIIMPFTTDEEINYIKWMVKDVNDNVLPPSERLSYSVYKYSNGELTIAC